MPGGYRKSEMTELAKSGGRVAPSREEVMAAVHTDELTKKMKYGRMDENGIIRADGMRTPYPGHHDDPTPLT